MFKCERCHRLFGPGVRSETVPTETRKVSYTARYTYKEKEFETMDELADMVRPQLDSNDRRHDELLKKAIERALEQIDCVDSGGEGTETVREQTVCPVCAGTRLLKDFEPYDPKLKIVLHEGTRAYKSATHFQYRQDAQPE